jgi:hypothetical protein
MSSQQDLTMPGESVRIMPTSGRLDASERIDSWSLIAAVKDEEVLRGTLLRSPDIDARCQIILKSGCKSASEAYNKGISEATGELLVFAHTDVYLPEGWLDNLARTLRKLSRTDPHWGVLGVVGIAKSGGVCGHVYSTGLKDMVGRPFDGCIETVSLDELLLITRRSTGLQFDEQLSGFHLYGTDICLEAKKRGMKNYIISAFCIHNSVGIRKLPRDFWRAYFYLRTKWWKELPIQTCCTTITKMCWPVATSLKSTIYRIVSPPNVGTRCADPELLYRDLFPSNSGHRIAK